MRHFLFLSLALYGAVEQFKHALFSLMIPRTSFSHSYQIVRITNSWTCLAAKKILPQMDNNYYAQVPSKEGEIEEVSRESCSKGACDYVPAKRYANDIIPHILNLYGSCATSHDFEIYAPHASFEDPLMCAHGVKQIKSAFYSLPKVFSESRIVEYSVKENVVSPEKREILIDNKQHYKFLGKDIDVVSLIKLSVEDGKVFRHEDWWDKKPLWNRETVTPPLVGRAMELTRRGSMLVTHAMMRFGKDPNM